MKNEKQTIPREVIKNKTWPITLEILKSEKNSQRNDEE